ncbi:LOW QUALITY PROTEIN: uncharacterized protein VSU04_015616 [Chlamydotis macqueenii]
MVTPLPRCPIAEVPPPSPGDAEASRCHGSPSRGTQRYRGTPLPRYLATGIPLPWHPITEVPHRHGTRPQASRCHGSPSPRYPIATEPGHRHPVAMAPHHRGTPSPRYPATGIPLPWQPVPIKVTPAALCPQELRRGRCWRWALAEAAATFVFVGVVLGASAAPEPLAPALAGGLAAAALACTLGTPQANPALTLALLCTRKLGALRGAAALLAQCAGAALASAAARLALPDAAGTVTRVSAPSPSPCPSPRRRRWGAEAGPSRRRALAGTAARALAWETFATFQLALAAFAAAHRAPHGALALGGAVAAGALAAGPFSGGSMNPACSLAVAIVTGVWDDHWVYWLGPVLGAVLAGLSYEFAFAPDASREKLGACLACRDAAPVETTSPAPSSPSPRSPPAPPGQGTA